MMLDTFYLAFMTYSFDERQTVTISKFLSRYSGVKASPCQRLRCWQGGLFDYLHVPLFFNTHFSTLSKSLS